MRNHSSSRKRGGRVLRRIPAGDRSLHRRSEVREAGPSANYREPQATRPSRVDAGSLLRSDERRICQLLNRLVKAGEASQPMILWQVEQALAAHKGMEDAFHSALQRAAASDADRRLCLEASAESVAIAAVLQLLIDSDENEMPARAAVLRRLFRQHARIEERQVIPRAQRVLGTGRLGELVEKMKARRGRVLVTSDERLAHAV